MDTICCSISAAYCRLRFAPFAGPARNHIRHNNTAHTHPTPTPTRRHTPRSRATDTRFMVSTWRVGDAEGEGQEVVATALRVSSADEVALATDQRSRRGPLIGVQPVPDRPDTQRGTSAPSIPMGTTHTERPSFCTVSPNGNDTHRATIILHGQSQWERHTQSDHRFAHICSSSIRYWQQQGRVTAGSRFVEIC